MGAGVAVGKVGLVSVPGGPGYSVVLTTPGLLSWVGGGPNHRFRWRLRPVRPSGPFSARKS